MRRTVVIGLVMGIAAAAVSGCGEGDTTTVIESAPAPTEATTTLTQAEQPQAEESATQETTTEEAAPQGDPPDVVGLTLPEAKKQLKEAGVSADVSNTDTALGI